MSWHGRARITGKTFELVTERHTWVKAHARRVLDDWLFASGLPRLHIRFACFTREPANVIVDDDNVAVLTAVRDKEWLHLRARTLPPRFSLWRPGPDDVPQPRDPDYSIRASAALLGVPIDEVRGVELAPGLYARTRYGVPEAEVLRGPVHVVRHNPPGMRTPRPGSLWARDLHLLHEAGVPLPPAPQVLPRTTRVRRDYLAEFTVRG